MNTTRRWSRRRSCRLALAAPVLVMLSSREVLAIAGEEAGGGGSVGSTGGPVSVGPGQAISLAVRRNGYARIEITNISDVAAEIEIDGGAFRETVTLQPGETFVISEIFDVPRVRIINKSAVATLSIKSKWL